MKHIEIELLSESFLLCGINYISYDGSDGSEGHLISFGFIFININIYF